jgi:hypothetical protein
MNRLIGLIRLIQSPSRQPLFHDKVSQPLAASRQPLLFDKVRDKAAFGILAAGRFSSTKLSSGQVSNFNGVWGVPSQHSSLRSPHSALFLAPQKPYSYSLALVASENWVNSLSNVSSATPVAPLRFLPMSTFATMSSTGIWFEASLSLFT